MWVRKFITVSILLVSFCAFSQKAYKGAELYSNQSWKYGKMEMRMRMAKGSGILSTFFTYKDGSELSGVFWEEIDIEVFGKNNAETFQSNIISNNPKKYSEAVHSPGFSLGDAYHTYTLEWTPNYVAWYLDGVEMRKTQGGQVGELTNSQSFRFNLWAANIAAWVGPFNTNALPAYQFVNWIKYSKYTPGTGNNGKDFTTDWRDDFNTFNSSLWSKANWTFNENLVDFDPANVVVKDGYLVLVISEAGKTGFTGSVPVDGVVNSIGKDESEVSGIQIYPNPASSTVYINGSEGEKWTLHNTIGEIVIEGSDSTIDIDKFPSGMYYLHINNSVKSILKR